MYIMKQRVTGTIRKILICGKHTSFVLIKDVWRISVLHQPYNRRGEIFTILSSIDTNHKQMCLERLVIQTCACCR